jgi:hypothetical protein
MPSLCCVVLCCVVLCCVVLCCVVLCCVVLCCVVLAARLTIQQQADNAGRVEKRQRDHHESKQLGWLHDVHGAHTVASSLSSPSQSPPAQSKTLHKKYNSLSRAQRIHCSARSEQQTPLKLRG